MSLTWEAEHEGLDFFAHHARFHVYWAGDSWYAADLDWPETRSGFKDEEAAKAWCEKRFQELPETAP